MGIKTDKEENSIEGELGDVSLRKCPVTENVVFMQIQWMAVNDSAWSACRSGKRAVRVRILKPWDPSQQR